MATATEDIVIGVSVDTKDATKSLKGIEDRIEELTKERYDLEIGTADFDRISGEIQQLEAELKNVDLQFEALDFEQKFTAGTDAVVGMAGGFAAAQGAMALMGTESETLEKAFTQMASALTITMGLRDLSNGVIALRKMGGAALLAEKGVVALNTAMKANPWGALLAAVLAVAAAVAVFVVKSRNAAKALDVQLQKSLLLNDARLESAKAIAEEKQKLDSLVSAAKDETLSKEARQEAIKQINEISPEYLGNISLETINSEDATIAINKYTTAIERKARAQAFAGKMAEIEAQILEKELMSNEELAESRTGLLDVTKNTVTWIKSKLSADEESLTMKETAIKLGKEDAENEIAGLKVKKQALKELMKSQQDALLQDEAFVRERGKQAEATKKLEDAQKSLADAMKNALNESLKAQEQDRADFYKALEQIENTHFDSFKTNQEKEEQAVQDKFFNMIELAKRYGEDTAMLEEALQRQLQLIRRKYATEERTEAGEKAIEIQKLLEEARIENIADENEREKAERQKKFDDETLALLEQGMLTAELEKEMKKKLDSDLAELDKKAKEEQRQRTVETINAGFQSAQNSLNALSSLSEAKLQRDIAGLEEGDKRREQIERQAFERGKKIQIAQAIISGLQGVVNIWSAASTIPQPYDAILRGINTAALIATTAAQISKIKSTPFGGGGSVSGGESGASAGAGAVPINNISNTAALVDQQQQEITAQVVVLESDITSTQENVTTVSELSSF